jgi:hypothetical protein
VVRLPLPLNSTINSSALADTADKISINAATPAVQYLIFISFFVSINIPSRYRSTG